MKNLLIFLLAVVWLPALSQQGTREGTRPELFSGRLSSRIGSLKKLSSSPLPVHQASRTMQGLLYKKSFKDIGTDHGNRRTKDPVVQEDFIVSKRDQQDISIRSGTIISNTDGAPFTSVVPADPVIAAGPEHLLQMVNGSQGALIRVLDKTGRAIMDPVYMHQAVGAPGYFGYGDPVAIYDQFADRFIITEFGSDSCNGCYPNTMIIGVSTSPDPTAGWYFYSFKTNGFLVDFPKYAAWPDILFASTNDFNSAGNFYLGTSLFAFDKISMLQGRSTIAIQRIRINSGDYNKFLSLAPVNISGNTIPVRPREGLFIYFHDNNRTVDAHDADSLGILQMNVNFNDSSLTQITYQQQLEVAPFKSRVCNGSRNCVISATGDGYDEISDRIMHKVYYRNFGTSEAIVLNHTVDANYPLGEPKAGIRWYQLSRENSNWNVLHQSTFSPGTDGRFMGAININASGQVALAYNLSGAGKFASLYFTGRNKDDSADIMSYQENLVMEGDGYGTQGNRWGDYSDLVVDPLNDSVFWYCGMYGSSSWRTRITALKLEVDATNLLPVVIKSIDLPSIIHCDNNFSPLVSIANNGVDTITSLLFQVDINGLNKDSFYWTGKIYPREVRSIDLEKRFELSAGKQYIFNVRILATIKDTGSVTLSDAKTFTLFKTLQEELTEDFETTPALGANWLSVSTSNEASWELTAGAAFSGRSALVKKNQVAAVSNQKSLLYLPPLQVQGKDSLYLSFQLAFPGRIAGGFNDSLEVLLGGPCSSSPKIIWSKWGNSLKTTPGQTPDFIKEDSTGFIPVLADWKEFNINITDLISLTGPFQLIIRSGSNKGHNLYLDKIKVYGVILPGILKKKGYLVYPNPSPGQIIVRHWKEPKNLRKVELYNSLGQRIRVQVFNGNATQELQYDLGGQPAGIYQVKLTYENSVITERIIKVK